MRHVTVTRVPLYETLHTPTPLGKTMVTDTMCRLCVIVIDEYELVAYLILLDMKGFHVIIGMDGSVSYHTTMNCYMKEIMFRIPDQIEFVF